LPEGTVLIGVSSIYWREAWKYGLRAFRYCHHDVGHALAAINMACSGLGWQARLLDHLGRDSVQHILGLTEHHEGEAEVADCLIAIWPKMDFPRFSTLDWQKGLAADPEPGEANVLSGSHVDWTGITEVSHASEKPFTGDYPAYKANSKTNSQLIADNVFPLRKAIHQRRSAVSMDGRTRISRDTFYQFMIHTVPTISPATFQSIPWEPQVHLGLFVHRVDGLPPGLYCLVRNPDHLQKLQDKMNPDFLWQKPESCPTELALFLLEEGDFKNSARAVSCGQDIAADGCFSLGMISAFSDPLQEYGPWFYPRLYWECGAIGQILYLQAEVSGIRSTGIGCFFDDSVHEIFGIQDQSYQSLYHFTVGGPVEDTRLTTLPAY
jgi:nitroreductase